ncbi:T9SS type A sorting domain-containing protein [Longitalea luteola]|uniref:T9SS type A sorting domain-containing protein n=1 Tax=Longitalea luteola TaxID=2812563 RepID=UPI001A96FFB8|nr:T9SS type A sorting domain-containing protein [Longitalea luteola]
MIVNSYYRGTGNPVTGATSLTVGTLDARGNAAPVANGDMILIIQMQGAEFNTSNNSRYGDGINGGNASGYLTSNLVAGRYEYNIVSSVSGNTLNLSYTLANNYYTRAYSAGGGTQAYQVIRVPRYYDVTISSGASITAPAWDGSTGGIVVIEAANLVTLNGSVTANALGFRGGGGKRFLGIGPNSNSGSGAAITRTDYRWPSPVSTADNTTGGAKGEGIAGTPVYYLTNGATNATTGTLEGYIGGSMGRGAPGNAGGGGTDGDPNGNQYNPGGGGGGNGGAGGRGGSGWDGGDGNASTYNTGGYGGAAFAEASLQRFVMGGGGGAGTGNNSTAGTTDYLSSGASGGGIIIIRARSYSGNGTVTANGGASHNVSLNSVTDAAGGGGAGGTIIVATNQPGSVGTHSITASANGGKGGDMTAYYAHGPGGGGGGGVVISNVIPANAITVNGGANGLTRTGSTNGPVNNVYNSTSGSAGIELILSLPVTFRNSNNAASQCGVLPITLYSWKGVFNNNRTYLNWQTDAGVNFSHFVIEHSTDGAHFSSLAQVTGATTNALTQQYAFVDASPASGINYYRLKMVDKDGQFTYSAIITIRTDVKAFQVTVSPNPFNKHVVIAVQSDTDEAVQFRVFNSDGKLMWRKTGFVSAGNNAQYFNDLQSLPAGIYVLKVTRKETTTAFKLIKQ